MADDRAAHGAPGSASPVPAFGFRPPPTLTPFMAVIAVALPATGFLAAAAITPDFAEPLFRKFFTGYLALVTTLVIGGMALWRVYLRRNGIPPIRFGTDAVEIPPGAVSHRSVRIPYDQILSAAAMNTLRGDSLVVDARRRPYVFPRKAFEQATAVEDIRRHLRDRILREDEDHDAQHHHDEGEHHGHRGQGVDIARPVIFIVVGTGAGHDGISGWGGRHDVEHDRRARIAGIDEIILTHNGR